MGIFCICMTDCDYIQCEILVDLKNPERDFWGICLIFLIKILFPRFSLFLKPRNTRENLALKKGPFSKVLLKIGDEGNRTPVQCG